MSLPRVVLRPRRARPFFARHPWVLATSIARVEGETEPGSEVQVLSHEGVFIARGLYNPQSQIRVRLYRWEDQPLDEPYWAQLVDAAVLLRAEVLGWVGPGTACRLIASEADGLSGLTVDRHDRWLGVQVTSLALDIRRDMLLDLISRRVEAGGVVLRLDRGIAGLEGLEGKLPEGPVRGELPEGAPTIVENGLRFEIDLTAGQKTGFYLDQRVNRQVVGEYARGRRVLDLFCYTGGFALNALQGGATQAIGVDSSGPAIEQARRNAVINGLAHARFESGDVLDRLAELSGSGQRFGLVICDPPKYARNPKSLDSAMRAYQRVNRAAIDVVEPGGLLTTCSCSGHVGRELFAQMLAQVAEQSGRSIQILEQRGAAPDHPVSASCLETDYLKCFICRIG